MNYVCIAVLVVYSAVVLAEQQEECSVCSSGMSREEQFESIPFDSEAHTEHTPLKIIDTEDAIPHKVVRIPGGIYSIGTNDPWFPQDGEGPQRSVQLSDFEMDVYAVSNAQFLQFVLAESYRTEAESFGWSFVFEPLVSAEMNASIDQAVAQAQWWLPVPGANWMYPEGPDRPDIFGTGRNNHPVVHVSYEDAYRFCRWRGMRLPTEAEWEVAARGGKRDRLFPWGNLLQVRGQHMCNIWQGEFPYGNTGEDGFETTCPVDAFPANGYGLYNMVGNVWEWVHDWYSTEHEQGTSVLVDPTGPESGTERVHKGGSYMCHKSTCYRYRNVARGHSSADSAATNVGFRCARYV